MQCAYFFHNSWYVAPKAPKNAREPAVWFNLRYVLRGSTQQLTTENRRFS